MPDTVAGHRVGTGTRDSTVTPGSQAMGCCGARSGGDSIHRGISTTADRSSTAVVGSAGAMCQPAVMPGLSMEEDFRVEGSTAWAVVFTAAAVNRLTRQARPLRTGFPFSVAIDTALRMVVLPIEPEVSQSIDPSQTLSFSIARHGTSVKAPVTERIRIQQDPGIRGIFPSTAVEVERVGSQLA